MPGSRYFLRSSRCESDPCLRSRGSLERQAAHWSHLSLSMDWTGASTCRLHVHAAASLAYHKRKRKAKSAAESLAQAELRYRRLAAPGACGILLTEAERRLAPRSHTIVALAAMPTRLSASVALSAVVLFAGCVTMPQSVGEAAMFYRDYVGPINDPNAARMRVSADGVIRVTPASTCADFQKQETGVALFSTPSTKDYRYLHNRKLGVQGDAPKGLTSTEIALEGERPVVLSYTRNWTVRGTAFACQMHRAFVPNARAQYQLQAEPLFEEGQCAMIVTTLTEPGSVVPTVPAKLCGS